MRNKGRDEEEITGGGEIVRARAMCSNNKRTNIDRGMWFTFNLKQIISVLELVHVHKNNKEKRLHWIWLCLVGAEGRKY
jgi:hypothetical protein